MPDLDLSSISAAAGPMQTWVLPALLGLGLASATGLRTFLPLLMLALAAKFEMFGVRLIDQMDWLVEDVLAFLTVIVAFLAPIVIPIVLVILAVVVFRLARRIRDRSEPRTA